MISDNLHFPAFKTFGHIIDGMTELFGIVREYPVASTLTGLPEAAVNTALAIIELPAVIALQIAKLSTMAIPFPAKVNKAIHKGINGCADDMLALFEKHIVNAYYALVTAVPGPGNLLAYRDKELKKRWDNHLDEEPMAASASLGIKKEEGVDVEDPAETSEQAESDQTTHLQADLVRQEKQLSEQTVQIKEQAEQIAQLRGQLTHEKELLSAQDMQCKQQAEQIATLQKEISQQKELLETQVKQLQERDLQIQELQKEPTETTEPQPTEEPRTEGNGEKTRPFFTTPRKQIRDIAMANLQAKHDDLLHQNQGLQLTVADLNRKLSTKNLAEQPKTTT